jgi:hypothetical protein
MTQSYKNQDSIKEPILTADDMYYTPAEVKNATDDLNHQNAPGEDGITGDIPKSLLTILDIYFHIIQTAFKERLLSEEVEKS